MVSTVVLANSFYCVLLSSYNGLYQPMYLRLIYWALVLERLKCKLLTLRKSGLFYRVIKLVW